MLEPCTQALSEEQLRHEYTIQLPPGNRVYQVPARLCKEEGDACKPQQFGTSISCLSVWQGTMSGRSLMRFWVD